jgi:hypothetical protein
MFLQHTLALRRVYSCGWQPFRRKNQTPPTQTLRVNFFAFSSRRGIQQFSLVLL